MTMRFLDRLIQSHRHKNGRQSLESIVDKTLRSSTCGRGLDLDLLYKQVKKFDRQLTAAASKRIFL